MAYLFYLDGLQLPVTPAKLQMKIKDNNKTVHLINEGEVNLLKLPGLTEVSFDALIPQTPYPFAGALQSTTVYLSKLEQLKVGKTPFQFIVSRTSPTGKVLFYTNLKVSLEDYTVTEDAKEGFDLKLSIKLKEYRTYGTKIVTVMERKSTDTTATVTVQQERPTESAPKEKTYTVAKGDSLWNIAQKCLGKGGRYPELYQLNQHTIDSRNKGTGNARYTIYPGQVLSLPD